MEPQKREAETWLSQLLEELRVDPYYVEGWDLLKRVEKEIRSLAPPLQGVVKRVLCDWLHQWGTPRVSYALDLIWLLRAKECLPALLDLWIAIAYGRLSDLYRPHLDSFWLSHIERVMQELDAPLPQEPFTNAAEEIEPRPQTRNRTCSDSAVTYSRDVERWLSSLKDELLFQSPTITWDEVLVRMEAEILSQPDTFQSEVRKVICGWLGYWDTDLEKVSLGIDLSVMLDVHEACPRLLELKQALLRLQKVDPLGGRYNFLWIRRLDKAVKAIGCQ